MAGPHFLERLLPGLAVLRSYRRSWLRGDLLAGLTVAAYLVPQVMAYADLAGLPPVAGLWAILAPLALYVLLGSSRHLSVGPIADLLSKPILVGYLAGVAVTMIVGQLGKLTRVTVDGGSIVAEVVSFIAHLPGLDPGTTLFAAAVLASLFLGQWRFPHVPTPLFVSCWPPPRSWSSTLSGAASPWSVPFRAACPPRRCLTSATWGSCCYRRSACSSWVTPTRS
jgi:MFS superfamily sulfate permease-like transporter